MAGRFFTDGEVWRNAPVLVLSNKLARELSPTGDPVRMLGRVVRVRGRPATVIGVMPPFTGELGYQIFIPLRAAATVLGEPEMVKPSLVVRAARIESVATTKGAIHEWLAGRYRDWERRVSVTSNVARLEQAQTAMLILKLVLGSLAGISLIVGGFGIMNVMLASVAERTREIGVHKALGARQRDILYQFLAEAVAIAGLGSGIGTAMGIITAVTVAAGVRWFVPETELHAAVTAGTLLLSVLSAAIIGLVFGTFPALRAARLSPIDAIRHD
jgi:putative ABC transport system permease protein